MEKSVKNKIMIAAVCVLSAICIVEACLVGILLHDKYNVNNEQKNVNIEGGGILLFGNR